MSDELYLDDDHAYSAANPYRPKKSDDSYYYGEITCGHCGFELKIYKMTAKLISEVVESDLEHYCKD